MQKETFKGNLKPESVIEISYEHISRQVLEIGEYFMMRARIEVKELLSLDLMYSIESSNEDWAIVGRSKVQIDSRAGPKVDVLIKAIAIRYGRVQIPQIKVVTFDGKPLNPQHVVTENGNYQMVTVLPKSITLATPRERKPNQAA